MRKNIPVTQMIVMTFVAIVLYPFFKIHMYVKKRAFLKNASAGAKNLYFALERTK